MRVLAIDFGTSNTVAMVALPNGRTRPLLFDGSPLLPSAVYLDPDGRVLVGRDAERSARLDPSRFEPNPKRRVDDGTILLGGVELPVARVIAAVLAQVLTEARRLLGAAPEQIRLTHPERWGERRRLVLLEAAQQAGLGNVRLVAEPVAAASYYTAVLGSALPVGRALAIYDLGGGTFDAAVVRRIATGFEVLAETGIPDLGGLDFDQAVVEHLGRRHRDDPQWTRLVSPGDAGDRRNRRMLYDDVRGAKEMLSRTASADIHLPTLGTDAHLTREEFETLVRPQLEQTVACLQQTIGQARLAPAHLVGIFLVGGSSRIPMAAHLIHTALGVAPTTLEQPETVVVEGGLCVGAPVAAAAVPQRPGHSGLPRPSSAHPVSPGRLPMPPRPVSPGVVTPPGVPPPAPTPRPGPTGPQPGSPAPVGPARPARPMVRPPPPPVVRQPPQVPAPPPARPVSGAAPVRPMPTPQQQLAPPPVVPVRPMPPQPQQMAQGPVVPVRPMPVPPRQLAPPPVVAYRRPWFQEPVRLATAVVLALVVVAFLILLAVSV